MSMENPWKNMEIPCVCVCVCVYACRCVLKMCANRRPYWLSKIIISIIVVLLLHLM